MSWKGGVMVSRCLAVSSILPCSADIALIGLAVMGQNLILNMNDHGFVVSWSRWMRCPCLCALSIEHAQLADRPARVC